MTKDYPEIIRDIQNEVYAPIYFLQGDEPFFIDNIIDHLEERVLDDAQKSFNQYIFYGKETDFNTIFSTARKFPMMGERQVVLVKEAQEIKDWNREDQLKLMLNYIENPLPSTILVFGYKYKSLDKRKKIGKAVEQQCVLMNSKKIYDNKIPGWITSYARARGIKITDKAVYLLSENIGNNLQRLSNEIEKLLINLDGETEIDENTVHKYIGISKEFNTFELQDALAEGNLAKALKISQYLASNPANPMVLTLWNLFSFFSKVLQIHAANTTNEDTLSKKIGVHKFHLRNYLQARRKYSKEKVLDNINHIHEADLKFKGIDMPTRSEREILKELVFKLIG